MFVFIATGISARGDKVVEVFDDYDVAELFASTLTDDFVYTRKVNEMVSV